MDDRCRCWLSSLSKKKKAAKADKHRSVTVIKKDSDPKDRRSELVPEGFSQHRQLINNAELWWASIEMIDDWFLSQVNNVKAELFLSVANESVTAVTDDFTGVLKLTLLCPSRGRWVVSQIRIRACRAPESFGDIKRIRSVFTPAPSHQQQQQRVSCRIIRGKIKNMTNKHTYKKEWFFFLFIDLLCPLVPEVRSQGSAVVNTNSHWKKAGSHPECEMLHDYHGCESLGIPQNHSESILGVTIRFIFCGSFGGF